MHLSAPIHALKRKAKTLSRAQSIPLHEALDRIAGSEGYRSWSHLAAHAAAAAPDRTKRLLEKLEWGDLVLLGARPRQGKTRLGLQLAARAEDIGRTGFFFTLDYHARDMPPLLDALGLPSSAAGSLRVDTSDEICAAYIMRRVESAGEPALVLVDYLQLLDQRRTHPSLDAQLRSVRAFARDTGAIFVLLSQIDRAFDPLRKPVPDVSDVRLPNPVSMALFDKTCFLHGGEIRFGLPA